MPQQLIQSYRTQVQVAEAQLASARAQRDAQSLRLRYARVVAPDDGVISSRSATVGAVSTMGAELFLSCAATAWSGALKCQLICWRACSPASPP